MSLSAEAARLPYLRLAQVPETRKDRPEAEQRVLAEALEPLRARIQELETALLDVKVSRALKDGRWSPPCYCLHLKDKVGVPTAWYFSDEGHSGQCVRARRALA